MAQREPIQLPGLEEAGRHHHLCLLYDGEEEILTPVVPFIQKGLSLGERCLYLHGGEETLERVLKNAVLGQKHDIGALKLLPVEECWLKGGSFTPKSVIELLASLSAMASTDGFRATRVICDMGWAAGDPSLTALLIEFELLLNRLAEQLDVTILSLYRRRAFPAEVILELAKLHPQLVVAGKICPNPLFVPAGHAPRRSRSDGELDLLLAVSQLCATAAAERERMRQELEQAYAALARKIYENWQEEDTLKASEKRLQEQDDLLLEHRRRLQTILQHLPAVMLAFDREGSVSACNHEFERITGFRPEEVMGRQMRELFHLSGEGAEEVLEAHPEEGGHYRGREWELRCKDGSLRSISWSNISRYVPIQGWANWITGLDVTPRIDAEVGLKSLSSELEARTCELELFGHAVSHDLSSQLAKIGAHCALMQELHAPALTPQCRELLSSIQQATLEMVGRINALERLTTLASAEMEPEEVDLTAMAREIAEWLRKSGERSVTFRIEEGVRARGDRRLLRLALEQLLENAWNYTAAVPAPVIEFGTVVAAGERSFYVSDNGPRPPLLPPDPAGCRKLHAEHLCCGIGLATVQRIITLHRGRIWAARESEQGGTLCFTVEGRGEPQSWQETAPQEVVM
ncbi:MEDS domain-containing protein [Geomonas sp. Red32]|uniref:MEDS domain-containing protein n=1 Tax=Geomonas sp. Red32 TaxID=2912856 RepID=UPI00202CDE8A|nr:MEDS domain-containing protein [Geomonas sp. Red32]MCM0081980.1 MEDS domain-containing protein [Geomonas sp. Red32]